ncbi:MAG: hypothetical protein ACRD6W_07705 [Nitrososphaerales archaeon]
MVTAIATDFPLWLRIARDQMLVVRSTVIAKTIAIPIASSTAGFSNIMA